MKNMKPLLIWGLPAAVIIAVVLILFRGGITRFFSPAPTPGCDGPSLEIGAQAYQILPIIKADDGSFIIPLGTPGTAYWLEGTTNNHVFFLSATDSNLALGGSLVGGEVAKVTGEDCNATLYSLERPELGVFENSGLLGQSTPGITIAVQDGTANSVVIRGTAVGEEIQVFNTPNPQDILAEISLLGTSLSADGMTIQVEVSIMNYGENVLTLTLDDVSLTGGDGPAVAPLSSEPALPLEIAPAASQTFYFTFTHPGASVATLEILGVEYGLEGY